MRLSAARCAACLLLLVPAEGADIGQRPMLPVGREPARHDPHSHSPLFPILKRLRDGAVELFFGPHPAKSASASLRPPSSIHGARYANELVVRFNVSTAAEEAALAEAASRLFLDVWAFGGDFVDIRLHSDTVAPLLGLLPGSLQTSHSVLIRDLAAAVYQAGPLSGGSAITRWDESAPVLSPAALRTNSNNNNNQNNLFFDDFQPLNVIVRWMRLLEAMFPSLVEYVSIGKSFDGRDIPALRLRVPRPPDDTRRRRTIVVTGGLHAREWISTSTVNYVAWSYVTAYGSDAMITRFLHRFDMVFVPAMNPDGIEHSWQADRLWRKSRQATKVRFCRGIDLDHAFGYGWDPAEPQSDPCSESYGGEAAFHAIEARRLADWALNETRAGGVDFVGLLDLHSYSQQVLFPYSYSCDAEPPNLENLQELAAGLAKAIRLSNGESYSVTSACRGAADVQRPRHAVWPRIESGGGSAIDWFYHELGAHYSFQIKLRDTGSYGFLLPREYIVPTGEEMFDAIKYFGDYLLGNNGIEKMEHASEELRRRRR